MCDCESHDRESAAGSNGGTPSSVANSIVPPGVPLARPVAIQDESNDAPGPTDATPGPGATTPQPPLVPCRIDFRDGCWQIEYRPNQSLVSFVGTLRVDRKAPNAGADNIIVSGDLYTRSRVIGPVITTDTPNGSLAAAASAAHADVPVLTIKPKIPIFARASYHSYLKVTSVSAPRAVPIGKPCTLTIVADQFNYTQPPAGQHQGSFPAAASRTVTMKLQGAAAPPPFSLTGGPYFKGRLLVAGVDKGSVTLAWVSKFYRRASVEIDVLTGAVAPVPVPDGAGGTEYFDTVFARTGWQLKVVSDQTNVPVPAGVTPTDCWSSANLHALMASVRGTVDLDKEWRIHLSVVPAKMGCGRGVMFDQIGVPREGCSSFCDDGYPSSQSANFGTAANKKQRDVARAFLRSATHELTHTFNQIHQEQETSADNSIMTTTPSVADVLGGPATGDPGVFPDQIKLAHNATVRNHLNHMPDPVIRPGGWPFASWFGASVPQASDRNWFDAGELSLEVRAGTDRLALGQPLDLSWTMTNRGANPLVAPNDVSIEALYASITVINAEGRARDMRTFVVRCEHGKLALLAPGASVEARTKVFWSTAGFAFERPGRYQVRVAVTWSARGVPVGVAGETELFVDFPTNDGENDAAGLVFHPQVGQWVALGGGAYHLDEAWRRLAALRDRTVAGDAPARVVQGFADLMPDRRRAPAAVPGSGDGAGGTRGAGRGGARKVAAKKTRRSSGG